MGSGQTIGAYTKHLILSAFCTLSIGAAAAPADQSDHPLLSRMNGFQVLEKESKTFDALDLKDYQIAGEQKKAVPLHYEGKITEIKYIDETQSKSNLQIFQNYETALSKLGAKQLNSGFPKTSDGVRMATHVFSIPGAAGGAPTQVLLFINSPQWYSLTFVEPAKNVQEVTAGKMAEQIKSSGTATLYIEFDTNKAELKSDGTAVVKEIAALMNTDRALKLSIEGHTDNVGKPADNKKLSQARAQAVMAAVVAQGIDAKRLGAVGQGSDYPIADNRSDDGRTKNRRVELVKQK